MHAPRPTSSSPTPPATGPTRPRRGRRGARTRAVTVVSTLALVVLVSGCWRLANLNPLVLWTTVGVPVQVCNVAEDDDYEFSATMRFDWGDGTLETVAVSWEAPRLGHCLWHAYAQPGTYQGSVSMNPGHQTDAAQPMTVTVAPPAGHLRSSGTCACHTTATFSALGLAASVQVIGDSFAPAPVHHWDFGDGTTATTAAATTSHTYAAPGTYAVTVTVTRAYHPALPHYHPASGWSTASVRVGP